MKATGYAALAITVVLSLPAWAQVAQPAAQASGGSDLTQLGQRESALNSKPGPRIVPGRAIPVPTDVSPELQKAIAAPYRSPAWDLNPKTPEGWKQEVAKLAAATLAKYSCSEIDQPPPKPPPIGEKIPPKQKSPAQAGRFERASCQKCDEASFTQRSETQG
jgi:hypothetical protein